MLNKWLRHAMGGDPEIEFLGYATNEQKGTTLSTTVDLSGTLTGGTGGTLQEDDFVIMYVSNTGYTNVDKALSCDSGYTSFGTEQFANDTYATNCEAFYKVVGSTPDTSVTVSTDVNTNNDVLSGLALCFRNVDIGEPFGSSVYGSTVTDTGNINPTNLTNNYRQNALFIGLSTHGTGNQQTVSATGYDDTVNITPDGNSQDLSVFFGMKKVPLSGSSSAGTHTVSATLATFSAACQSFYIQPMPDGITLVGYKAIDNNDSDLSPIISINTGLTGGIDTAARYKDLVVVVWAVGTHADASADVTQGVVTSGYTSMGERYVSTGISSAYAINLEASYKVMGSTPDTTVEVSRDTHSSGDSYVLAVMVLRGVNPDTPVDTAFSVGGTTGTVLPNPDAKTLGTANAVYFTACAGNHGRGDQTYTSSSFDEFYSPSGSSGSLSDVSVGIGFKKGGSGETINPGTFGFSSTDNVGYVHAEIMGSFQPRGS